MPVFQCVTNIQLLYHYERYNLKEGQLVAVNESKLVKFLSEHPNIREIEDEVLLRIAPPLHLIKDPQDPYRMRKEDIINELRSYGISVDPYDFSQKLTMQLNLARKMLNRNFLTVLNKQGIPVFIDRTNMPVPSLSQHDENLSEPDLVDGEEYFSVEEIQRQQPEMEIIEIKRQKKEPDKEKPMPKDTAMMVEQVKDDKQINQGMGFDEFVEKTAKKQYEKAPVIVQKIITPIFEEETVEEPQKEEFVFEGKNQLKYLLETQDREFMINDEEIDEKKLSVVKWTKINIDVFENFMRYYGIVLEELGENVQKRWNIIYATKEFVENSENKIKHYYEINMLQKRHEELCELEPSYRNFSALAMKRRLTELCRYGINIDYYKTTDVRKYAKKVFTLAKLGLQVPDTEEEIDKKLISNNRGAIIK